MPDYGEFKSFVKSVADRFRDVPKSETIRLVSHLDADGISSASIIIRALSKDNRKYVISIVHQLNKQVIEKLSKEDYIHYIFTDLGSGQLGFLEQMPKHKKIIVLDHHHPSETDAENITHVNPHSFGIDGTKEISGAGVTYLFSNYLINIEDMAHVAVVGAIGDRQDDEGFYPLNQEILEIAIKNKLIQERKGLRFFGMQTKPLHKVLEYCSDPFIPGVTGSESGAIQFLNDLGIAPKEGNNFRKVVHLSLEEMQRLVTGIVLKRADEDEPGNVLGNNYTLLNEKEESPFRDAKEFATLLNATGRLARASLGISVCLGNKKAKEKAMNLSSDYKKEVTNAIGWFRENKSHLIRGKNYIILNTQGKVLPTMVGTLASMISGGNDFEEGTIILSLGQLGDGYSKISMRIAGRPEKANLREVIGDIAQGFEEAEVGGHDFAAGAMIRTEDELEFIEKAKLILEKSI